MTEICPVCEEGTLTEHIETTTLHPRGFPEKIQADLKHSVCDVCGSEIADKEQINYNHQQILKQKDKILCRK